MTTLARDSRSACTRKSSLLATFTAAVTAPIRAAPNQKYTHSGQVAVNSATVSPLPTPMSTNAFAAARDRSRICSNVTGVPAIDISNRSRKLLGALIQHGRDREALDTELRRTDRPVRPAGFRHPLPPGPVHPSAV